MNALKLSPHSSANQELKFMNLFGRFDRVFGNFFILI